MLNKQESLTLAEVLYWPGTVFFNPNAPDSALRWVKAQKL